MIKILMSFLAIALVSTAAFGATQAYFSDTETSTGNTFAAGTLDLNLDGGNINVTKFTITNAKPGDLGTGVWTVYNAGSIDGYIDIHSIALTNDDNTCTEPESTDGDNTCGVGGGELSANMNVNLFIDVDGDGIFDAGDDTTIYSGLLSGISADYNQNIVLAASATKYISMNWEIPAATGNVIQSDSLTMGMTFELGQTTGQ